MLRRLAIALAVPLAAGCQCAGLPSDLHFCGDDGGVCDGGLLADGGDAGPSCVPTMCPATMSCGLFDAGCGMQTLCGICDAGAMCIGNACTACIPNMGDDPPDDAFNDTDCDGIDGEARNAIFVDPGAADDTGTGSMNSPVKTLQHALAIAAGKTMVLVSEGRLDTDQVEWGRPISLYGGYHANAGWHRDAVLPYAMLDGGTLALHIFDAGMMMTVDSIDVTSAAAVDGGSSFAILVERSALLLRNAMVRSGRGGDGADGIRWMTNADDGLPGAKGQDSTDPSSVAVGANGVGSTCGGMASEGGGNGASITSATNPAVCGGGGGASSIFPAAMCTDMGLAPVTDGADGTDGGDGMPGGDGMGGMAGMLAGTLFIPSDGTAGKSGLPGYPGGCAGGGGAVWRQFEDAGGGGGASGGTGGCGGDGGNPGLGGGASIGILLVEASVTVENAQVYAGPGGNGGKGAQGQKGGGGGLGGTGGNGGKVCAGNGLGRAGNGGKGGVGGKGGKGGGGGGGAGGPSVGIWCAGNSGRTVPPALTPRVADAGLGGEGGGTAPRGHDSFATPYLGCP